MAEQVQRGFLVEYRPPEGEQGNPPRYEYPSHGTIEFQHRPDLGAPERWLAEVPTRQIQDWLYKKNRQGLVLFIEPADLMTRAEMALVARVVLQVVGPYEAQVKALTERVESLERHGKQKG